MNTRRALSRWMFSDTRILAIDLVALLFLFGCGVIGWVDFFHSKGWTPDGMQYQTGIDLVRNGRSPYEQAVFPYPPTIAVLGAWIAGILGNDRFLTLFRYVNFLGGCAAVWGSVLLIRTTGLLKLLIALLGIAFLPALGDGLETDNLSTLAAGLSIMGLAFWQRLPVLMGIVLGFGLALKPIALAGLFALAAHRNPLFRRNRLATSLAAFGSAGLLVLLEPSALPSALFQPSVQSAVTDWASAVQNVSLFRVMSSFGFLVPPIHILLAVVLVTVVYVRTRPLNLVQFLCVALASSLLSLPIVWQHTLLLITPVAFIATALAFEDFIKTRKKAKGPGGRNQRLRSLSQLLFVASGSKILLEANAFGVLANWHPVVNGVAHLVPITTLFLLTAFIVRKEDRRQEEIRA